MVLPHLMLLLSLASLVIMILYKLNKLPDNFKNQGQWLAGSISKIVKNLIIIFFTIIFSMTYISNPPKSLQNINNNQIIESNNKKSISNNNDKKIDFSDYLSVENKTYILITNPTKVLDGKKRSVQVKSIAELKIGDTLKYESSIGEYYKTYMFAGEERLISKKDAQLVKYQDFKNDLPQSLELQKEIFRDIGAAQDCSQYKADQEFPLTIDYKPIKENYLKNTDYQRILQDTFTTQVLHEHNIKSLSVVNTLLNRHSLDWDTNKYEENIKRCDNL